MLCAKCVLLEGAILWHHMCKMCTESVLWPVLRIYIRIWSQKPITCTNIRWAMRCLFVDLGESWLCYNATILYLVSAIQWMDKLLGNPTTNLAAHGAQIPYAYCRTKQESNSKYHIMHISHMHACMHSLHCHSLLHRDFWKYCIYKNLVENTFDEYHRCVCQIFMGNAKRLLTYMSMK